MPFCWSNSTICAPKASITANTKNALFNYDTIPSHIHYASYKHFFRIETLLVMQSHIQVICEYTKCVHR